MNLEGKVVVVTGAASGIGRALAMRFSKERPKGVVVSDIDGDGAAKVAAECGGLGVKTDVASEASVKELVKQATDAYGPIDLFCSNAGIFIGGAEWVDDADWRRIIDINVMAHIYAARAVVPGMIERGGGYFLSTVSAAGLLSQIGSAPYAVTKHAALAFNEWLSITYGDKGLRVSCICPQGVRTAMLGDGPHFLLDGSLAPETVADVALAGIAEEKFLILPHPEVATYFERKGTDYERWLKGMRRLNAKVFGG